ncbi:MAG: LemA family protein [Eubacterium sp.]|nr:LemA family protein [Eubacterium sp.]
MGWVVVLVFVALGIFYILLTVKINKFDMSARDKCSEIDTGLWDRAHQLSKIVDILDKKDIKHTIDVLDVNTFGLGMPPVMQATNADKLDKQDEILREVLKEHPELKEDEEFETHLNKFNDARNELIRASMAYNKSANEFNHLIAGFPASIIAMIYKKKDKAIFIYFFKELGD